MSALPETNPIYGPFFGVMGAASAIIFSGKYSSRTSKIYSKKYCFFLTISKNISKCAVRFI